MREKNNTFVSRRLWLDIFRVTSPGGRRQYDKPDSPCMSRRTRGECHLRRSPPSSERGERKGTHHTQTPAVLPQPLPTHTKAQKEATFFSSLHFHESVGKKLQCWTPLVVRETPKITPKNPVLRGERRAHGSGPAMLTTLQGRRGKKNGQQHLRSPSFRLGNLLWR